MSTFDPHDPAGIDDLLSVEEKAVRDSVRRLCADSIDPFVADWFERGTIDDVRGLAKTLGGLGLLGMHLDGYGCAAMSATDYGLACLELEASDSGIRSLVSVYRDRWQCSLCTGGAARSTSNDGCRAWQPASSSDASALPSPTPVPTRPACAPGLAVMDRAGARRPQDVDHHRVDRRRRHHLGTD